MKTVIFFASLALGMLAAVASFAAERESYYSDRICAERYNGYEEQLPSGLRPDCQTEFVIIEFDWATRMKSYECIGQSLVYAQESGKIPVCVLLARNEDELDFGNGLNFESFGIKLVVINTRSWDPQ